MVLLMVVKSVEVGSNVIVTFEELTSTDTLLTPSNEVTASFNATAEFVLLRPDTLKTVVCIISPPENITDLFSPTWAK